MAWRRSWNPCTPKAPCPSTAIDSQANASKNTTSMTITIMVTATASRRPLGRARWVRSARSSPPGCTSLLRPEACRARPARCRPAGRVSPLRQALSRVRSGLVSATLVSATLVSATLVRASLPQPPPSRGGYVMSEYLDPLAIRQIPLHTGASARTGLAGSVFGWPARLAVS
jgi:hypothetical protein